MNNKDAKVASSSGSPSETENNQPAETKSQVALFATSAADEKRFLEWWFKNRDFVLGQANCDPMFQFRIVARAAWHAALKSPKSANNQAQVSR